MFTSTLRPNELVIGEDNYLSQCGSVVIGGEEKSFGHIPRDWYKEPFGSLPYAAAWDIPNIPESEWAGRIEEMERTKTRLSDIVLQAGIPTLDQNGTNYCWFNGVVTAVESVRCLNGLPYIKLSSASGAAPIKGFRNQGGWGGEALDWIIKNGVCPASAWPPNAIDRRYYTEENKQLALRYRVTEWYELPNRNFNALMTACLLRIPVAVGYNWWRHEVCAFDGVVLQGGNFGIRIRNSWGNSYGDRGFAVLTRSKATPDDAVAPRVPMATAA